MTTNFGKWKLVIYLFGIFATGAVSGWVVAEKATKEKLYSRRKQHEIHKSLKDLCTARLKMAPEQQMEVDKIINDNWKVMQGIHEDHMQQIHEALARRSARIMKILTPEQQAEFEAIECERREAWRTRNEKPP